MLVSLFFAFLLPCVGMSAVFVVYICLLWYASARSELDLQSVEKPTAKGLSASDLQKLPSTTAGGELIGTECAVCLDEIEIGQPARLLPSCHHGFHLHCADAWLSKNPVCPVCRAKIEFSPLESGDNLC